MRYYFRLDNSGRREEALLRGEEPEPIKLFVETPDKKADFESENGFEWWPVWRFGDNSANPGDFDSYEVYKEVKA